MKERILICSALIFALTGCNSSPSNSDLEDYLNPIFVSCKNLKIVDIKKTNGYQEDGYYRVEFSYGLELKDPSLLDTMRNRWNEEKEEEQRRKEATKNFHETRDALEKDIEESAQDIGMNVRFTSLSNEIIVRNQGFSAEVTNVTPEFLQEKINKWKNLVKNREYEIESQKPFKIFGYEETVVYKNYYNGCNPSVKQFTKSLFEGQQFALLQSDDKTPLFNEYKVNVNFILPMRKTENGWRVISKN